MIVLIGVVQIVHLIFSKLPQKIMIIPRFPIYFLIGLVTVRFNTLEKDPKFDFFDETTQLATCPECNYKIDLEKVFLVTDRNVQNVKPDLKSILTTKPNV